MKNGYMFRKTGGALLTPRKDKDYGKLTWMLGGHEEILATGAWRMLQLKLKQARLNPGYAKGTLKISY